MLKGEVVLSKNDQYRGSPWETGGFYSPDELKLKFVELYKTTYAKFNMTHALEKRKADLDLQIPYAIFQRWWDDATSDIPHSEFFDSESTLSCMVVLRKVIEKMRIPECIYVDRAGLYGGTATRSDFSQFGKLPLKIPFAVAVAVAEF